jgi:hypothetical protein
MIEITIKCAAGENEPKGVAILLRKSWQTESGGT